MIPSEIYLRVVTDPDFRRFGFTLEEILKVRRTMNVWATTKVDDVLKEDPR